MVFLRPGKEGLSRFIAGFAERNGIFWRARLLLEWALVNCFNRGCLAVDISRLELRRAR